MYVDIYIYISTYIHRIHCWLWNGVKLQFFVPCLVHFAMAMAGATVAASPSISGITLAVCFAGLLRSKDSDSDELRSWDNWM